MKTFVKGVALCAVVCLGAGYFSSPSRAGMAVQKRPAGKGAGAFTPEELARTKGLFEERCARCHGADGRGKTSSGDLLGVPDFTDEEWWKEGKSDKRLVASVTEGRDAMPSFGKKLSRAEINALVAYVRRFNKAGR